jgi:hypothetical protein
MCAVVIPERKFKSRIQLLSWRACATVRFFLANFAKKSGAMSFGLRSCNQPEYQKLALVPSPRVMRAQFAKSNLSASSQGTSIPTQAFSGAVHSCHNQRRRNARENL